MIRLSDYSTDAPQGTDEKKIRKKTKEIAKEIQKLQAIMHAQKKHSLLVVFQGMDSSGKDGATRETFKYCSPSGVKTKGYGKPTDEEFAHDFLWRVHPYDNNTTVLKFYMHLSKDRQEEKLMERIETPRKQFKHNDGDWEERKHWDRYIECYEDLINRCTIPWVIAPVDQRWYRNYFIASKVLETLQGMNLEFPKLETDQEEWKKYV